MIRMLTACTMDPDDAQTAVAEILEQLDLDAQLLANTAAFLTCSYDFIETGVVEAVCAALPFEVVGCTTLTSATPGGADAVILCVSVLTSDDCRFAVATSAPLDGELRPPLEAAYQTAAGTLPAAPALVLAFFPMIRTVGGELILHALDSVVGGVPIFGIIGCDQDTSSYADTYTIHNGVCSRDRLSMLIIEGAIQPRFVIASASEDKIQKQKAIITTSEGSVLKTVNNIPAAQYLKSLGLIKGDGLEGLSAIPFIVNYNDGTQPVARAIYMLTPEGWAVCGGAMPENATLSIGSIDYGDILLTAEQSIQAALAEKVDCLITFPCLGRSLVLGADLYAEVDRVRESIGGRVPWHLAYSGGESCPVYDESGKPQNRFHNFTFIACVF